MEFLRKAKKAARLLSTPRFRRALRHGVAATIEHRDALTGLDVRTVVDIGANKGQFSLLAAELFPNAGIWAFEPLAEPRKKLTAVLGIEARVRVYPAAIGPEKANAIMNVSNANDSSSLLPITKNQTSLFPNTYAVGTEGVRVEPLHEFLSADDIVEPALLKIDVQGYEKEALEGCGSLLDCFENIYVECSFIELYAGQAFAADVINVLAKRNYKLVGVYDVTYASDGKAVQADFLFRRNGVPALCS